MNVRNRIAIAALVVGLVGLAVIAVLTPYTLLRDASGAFQGYLRNGGYPTATITETRVDAGGGRSTKGYDARIEVNDGCLLRLQMSQPGLFGGDFSLLEVNGRPLQLDGSPTYDQTLVYAVGHGYTKCKR